MKSPLCTFFRTVHTAQQPYTLWIRNFTPALPSSWTWPASAGAQRRRESEENFAISCSKFEFGHLRRAQARSAESESEENFAVFQPQMVGFEHSLGFAGSTPTPGPRRRFYPYPWPSAPLLLSTPTTCRGPTSDALHTQHGVSFRGLGRRVGRG